MTRNRNLDDVNGVILQILSLYERLTVSDLWFEIGESDTSERISKEELQKRLEFLKTEGFVKGKTLKDGKIYWAFRNKLSGDRISRI